MKQNLMQKKVYIVFFILSFAILSCFVIFFISVLNNLQSTNQKYVEQIADSAISKMEDVFLNLEYISVSFSNNEEVQDMLLEEDIVAYHEKASSVKGVLNSIYQADGLVDNILIYDMDFHYYRLRGELGNTSCDRIGVLLTKQENNYIMVELIADDYIAYINNIYDGSEQIGYIVFLIETEVLEQLFEAYDSMESIQIAIVSDDTILATNTEEITEKTVTQVEEECTFYINHQIGYTPFQVMVTDKDEFIWTMKINFFVLIFILCFVLLGFILFFYKFLNKTFFRPIINVIENVENIILDNEMKKIKLTGEKEFDLLVSEINSMIDTLDDNARTMLEMQYEQQISEIEQQKMEIDFLKKQINVHFTVNTINVIRRLNELGDNEKVGEICNALSNLLRYANGAGDYVEGAEELHVIEEYLDIMHGRQNKNFTWKFDIEEQVFDLLLPKMLLQPIVENAFTHGIELVENGNIEITAKVIENKLVITVFDNGVGMSECVLAELQDKIQHAKSIKIIHKGLEHIALINIQKRVEFFCGEHYGLAVSSVENEGTKVVLTLPILENEDITNQS